MLHIIVRCIVNGFIAMQDVIYPITLYSLLFGLAFGIGQDFIVRAS